MYLQRITTAAVLIACVTGVLGRTPARGTSQSSRQPTRAPAPSQDYDQEFADDCPEPDGYFADGAQCDKYYECIKGKITEKLCPDGMVFNDYDIRVEKCDLPFGIDCSSRPGRQEPKATLHCRRLNGYFSHEDPKICDKFYYCVDGKYNMITCPSGLVYNENTGICTWPDEAKKKGCSSEEVFKFDCPKVGNNTAQQHPRYADPEDCQFFYVCINGDTPRRNGCKLGQVFNDDTGSCDWPRNVPECVDWYKGKLTDEELEALERPKPKKPSTGEAANRRKGQRPRTHETAKVQEEPVRQVSPPQNKYKTFERTTSQVQEEPERHAPSQHKYKTYERTTSQVQEEPERHAPSHNKYKTYERTTSQVQEEPERHAPSQNKYKTYERNPPQHSYRTNERTSPQNYKTLDRTQAHDAYRPAPQDQPLEDEDYVV